MSGVKTQPIVLSHVSAVHTLLSSHFLKTPWQLPVAQLSWSVQALPSSQGPVTDSNVQPMVCAPVRN